MAFVVLLQQCSGMRKSALECKSVGGRRRQSWEECAVTVRLTLAGRNSDIDAVARPDEGLIVRKCVRQIDLRLRRLHYGV